MVRRRLLYAHFVRDEVRQTLQEVRQRRADEATDRFRAQKTRCLYAAYRTEEDCGRRRTLSSTSRCDSPDRSTKEPRRPPRSRPASSVAIWRSVNMYNPLDGQFYPDKLFNLPNQAPPHDH
jgi:hypothetical protein